MARNSGARCIHNVAPTCSRPSQSCAPATVNNEHNETAAIGPVQPRAMKPPTPETVLRRQSISEAAENELAGFGQRIGLPVVVEQVERLDPQVTQRVRRTAGLGEQEPLRKRTTHAAQDFELLPALDAFGDDLDVEAAGHGDHGTDDGVIGGVGDDVTDELAVDLERVDAPALEVRQ